MLQSFKTPPPKTEAIKGRGWGGLGAEIMRTCRFLLQSDKKKTQFLISGCRKHENQYTYTHIYLKSLSCVCFTIHVSTFRCNTANPSGLRIKKKT